jgi:twinkle protein
MSNGFTEVHLACPECSSSDGAAKNADGSIKCFACDKFFPASGGASATPLSNAIATVSGSPVLISGKLNALATRSIKLETAKFYGVLSDTDSTGKDLRHFYPYNLGGSEELSYKTRRTSDKQFGWVNPKKGTSLFGMKKFRSGGKYLTLVEGECDAMAAYELMGSKWAAVSVQNGAGGAANNVRENLEYLESFESVVICFDQDKVGQAAALEVAALLTPSKAKIMVLPEGFKDPNDMLKSNRHSAFVAAFWAAKTFTPAGILNVSESKELYLNKKPLPFIPYPWAGLNEKMDGMRGGELITLTGGSGSGKSTASRELTHWLLNTTTDNVGVMALEENWSRTIDGIIGINSNTQFHRRKFKEQFTAEEISNMYDAAIPEDRLWIYGHHGVSDIESIFSRLRFLIVGCQCKWVIVDHLHMLVLADKSADERTGIDHIMGRLSSICEETGVGIILVSHLKRVGGDGAGHEDGGQVSMGHLRGSQSIAQLSHNCIAFERNQQSGDLLEKNTCVVRVLKCREVGDTGIATNLLYNVTTGRMVEQEPSEFDAVTHAEEVL